MAHDLVSVVIPAYNQGQFVQATVLSALAQTYQPVEVIVVDDGSTDDTKQQLAPFLKQIIYVHQKNAGLSAARNTGIRRARGEWIALLDADDLWHRQKLQIQLEAIQGDSDVALIGSPSAKTLPDVLPPAPITCRLTVRDFLLSTRMGPSSVLIRRRAIDSYGMFDETLRSVEDRDMWLRIAAQSQCVLVESPCWWYRRHPAQMSRNAERMFLNYRRVLQNFFATNPGHSDLRRLAMSYLYFDAAVAYSDEGENVKALRCLISSTIFRPAGLGDPRRPPFVRLKLAGHNLLEGIHKAASRVFPVAASEADHSRVA